jgi:hypothetical protein
MLDLLAFPDVPGPFGSTFIEYVMNGEGLVRVPVKLRAFANVRVPAVVARGVAFFLIWGPLSELESSESGVAYVELGFVKAGSSGRGR